MIKDRRSGSTTAKLGVDLLSILTFSELYSEDEELILDELFGFFFAGMKTI
jgi:hypothetical protein